MSDNNYLKYFIAIILLMNGSVKLNAQVLPPYLPEQDACHAINLCNYYFSTPYSYWGNGKNFEVEISSVEKDCIAETNSVWFRIKIATAGNIVFRISPVNEYDDYDFAVINSKFIDCADSLGKANNIVRCNSNCNGKCSAYPGPVLSSPKGVIGLDYTSNILITRPGVFGDPFLQYIAANAGDEYLILVNNYNNSTSGFSIDFKGSTAEFEHDAPITSIDSVSVDCTSDYKMLKLTLKDPILCNSIAADGSDFELPGIGINVIGAKSNLCTGNTNGYSREIMLTLDASLKEREYYTIRAKKGTDNNTLLDFCDEGLPEGASYRFIAAPPLMVDAGRDTATCVGGQILLKPNVSGFSTGDRIRWQPAMYLNDITSINPVTTPQNDIEYIVTVVPASFNSCRHSDTIRIKVLKGFDLLTKDTAICAGSSLPIKLGGDQEFNYSWSPADGLSGNDAMSKIATPLVATKYTVTASYPGCKDSSRSMTIALNAVPIVDLGPDTTICAGDAFLLQAAALPAGNTYSYSWLPANQVDNPIAAIPSFTAKKETVIQLSVLSGEGCQGTDTKTVFVKPAPHVEAGIDQTTIINKPVTLMGHVDHTESLTSVTWTPPEYLSGPGIVNPVAVPPVTQLYYLTAVQENGCRGYDSVTVFVLARFSIPNAFSPNNDGINDTWEIPGISAYPGAIIQVFNRYGQMVFRSLGYARAWNGNYNGKPLPAGAYYYIIDARLGESKQTGTITILR